MVSLHPLLSKNVHDGWFADEWFISMMNYVIIKKLSKSWTLLLFAVTHTHSAVPKILLLPNHKGRKLRYSNSYLNKNPSFFNSCSSSSFVRD